jgi:cytochrome P450
MDTPIDRLNLYATAEPADRYQAAGRALLTPETYGDPSLADAAARLLRNESPIQYVDHPEYRPLWVLTRYEHIREVEAHHHEWSQGGHPFLRTNENLRRIRSGAVERVRMLIDYDGEEHREYRAITQKWFTPRTLAGLEARINELATRAIDKMCTAGGRCDFADDIAAPFPLETILSILGLPDSDFGFMLQLSQQLLNSDPNSESARMSEADQATMMRTFAEYFTALTLERRARPTNDLASVIANASIQHGPMPMPDAIGYYIILSVAGHDTTSATMSTGIHAFCTNPDQYELLRANVQDKAFVATAADEVIRWATAVKHFCRTAKAPYLLGNHQFNAGDRVFLSYASANRDERVFEDPHRFDITRANAGDNLAFGFGAHYCLGAQLARMQVRALLRELATRIDTIEFAGPPRFASAIATSGATRLPVRYALATC